MRLNGGFWLAVFFVALGLFGIIHSLTFGHWESMVLPLAMSSLIVVMGAVEAGRELHRQKKQQARMEIQPQTDKDTRAEMRRIGLIFTWTAGFALGIYLLGFYIAVPIFVFSYSKWRGRSWLAASIIALGIIAFVYGVFGLGLKATLFRGIIFGGH